MTATTSSGKIVHVIRHGEAEHNVDSKAQLKRDTELTGKGHKQAAALRERVKAMGLFATEISELTGESRIGEPIGLLARLNDVFMWMLFGVFFPYVCIRIAWQVPEQLEGKQWFIVPILGGLSLYNVWHRLKKGEWIKPGG